jgi:hypothetical protein
MRKRAKGLLPSRLTEDNIVEMSICDRGNALEKDVGKRQHKTRRYVGERSRFEQAMCLPLA